MKRPIIDVSASVRQKLMNLARERNEDFGLVLTKYGLERILYRISRSNHREIFVLKGGLLFELWTEQRHRPTRDADFLGRGQGNPERFAAIFKELCALPVEDDGLLFDSTTVGAERIIEGADYQGIRLKLAGYLKNARIPIQIDIGFGDVITPAPIEAEIPSLLNLPKPKLWTYPRESVIAEKFEAMISLGMTNSRMKDLYDIISLSREFRFEGIPLAEAIKRTFATRGTQFPAGVPIVFTKEFFGDDRKKSQWSAFLNKNRDYVQEMSLESVTTEIASFLMPVIDALRSDAALARKWMDGRWA